MFQLDGNTPLIIEAAQQVLEKWNATQHTYLYYSCIHRLFAAQARGLLARLRCACVWVFSRSVVRMRRATQLICHLIKLGGSGCTQHGFLHT
jgi:hypothetical protein